MLMVGVGWFAKVGGVASRSIMDGGQRLKIYMAPRLMEKATVRMPRGISRLSAWKLGHL
jgi:hypothetical protein